jgi:hypothetical protein
MPLPRSGVELDAAFYSFDAHGTGYTTATQTYPRYLTRSFLQNDPLCQEMSEIHPLVGRIFAHSDQNPLPPTRPSEIAAGFRYYLPDGRLSFEWVSFFDIVPDRFLAMAPPDVRKAYEATQAPGAGSMMDFEGLVHDPYGLDSAETRQLVDDMIPVVPDDEEEAEDEALPSMLPSQTSGSKRKRAFSPPADEADTGLPFGQGATPPEPKRTRLTSPEPASGGYAPSGQAYLDGPYYLPPADYQARFPTVNSVTMPDTSAIDHFAPSDSSLLGKGYGAAASTIKPVTASHPLASGLNGVAAGGAGAAAPVVAAALAHPVTVPASAAAPPSLAPPVALAPVAPAVAPGAPHQLSRTQLAANTPLPPIPYAQQSRNYVGPPRPPAGSMKHTGQGHVSKAWNNWRRRAFTAIQLRPAVEMSTVADSQYNDEMSRGHTPKSIDPRLIPWPTTIEKNLTVSTPENLRRTVLTQISTSPGRQPSTKSSARV